MCASSMMDEKWPLNERRIAITVDGKQKEISALDDYWAEKRPMAKYYPFPADKGNLVTTKHELLIEEWVKDTTVFNEDLLWLLQLEHHRFWSQVIFDRHSIQSVLSFLQEATPCYTPLSAVTSNESVLTLYGSVLKNVVTNVCRLVTAKESDVDWITKDALGDWLYSNYLVSIPMIFDLAIALGPENHVELNKIITQMIKVQPKYQNDLLHGLEYIQASVRSVEDQAQTMIQKEIDGTGPDSHGLEMLALYTLDCVVTLSVLLEAYPDAKDMANNAGLVVTLTQFYENCVPLFYKMVCENDKNETTLMYLSKIRLEILNTFHGIANYYLENLLNMEPSGLAMAELSEKIISLFEESLDDSTFVIDYQKIFPVENDLDVIRQANNDLNALRLDYVQVGYRDAQMNQEKKRDQEENEPEMTNGDLSEPEEEEEGAYGAPPESQEVPLTDEQKKIRQIVDVFPDYGDGFIRKVLLRYDMNPELVIAAILEGNLPPDLATMDTSEPYIPPEEAPFFEETGIKRLNIYDGDEFDVLANNANEIKGIYKKGVGEPKKWDTLLNDKTHVHENKEKYSALGYVSEDEYDDEYDDSYDALAESEAKSVRYKPAANYVMDEESDESSDNNEEAPAATSAPDNRNKGKDFCENPEVARARYEQLRQQKFGNRKPTGQKSRDVVGKPKGQGQDSEKTVNRQKKGVNKSVTGNHNRKRGADFKRSKGMF